MYFTRAQSPSHCQTNEAIFLGSSLGEPAGVPRLKAYEASKTAGQVSHSHSIPHSASSGLSKLPFNSSHLFKSLAVSALYKER